MKRMNQQLAIGQRVRVIDGGLPQYGQVGLVIAVATAASWYVRLDDGVADRTFFQTEELEAIAPSYGQPSVDFRTIDPNGTDHQGARRGDAL